MKKLLLLLSFVLLCSGTYSQEELKFSKVIQSPTNSDKLSLHVALRSFVASYYKNSQNVIQMDDKEAGIIICKATTIFPSPSLTLSAYEGFLDYTLKLQSKDGRVRVEVSTFMHHNLPGNQKAANIGLLTTSDVYATSGIQKKYHNKVWLMLKEKAVTTSEDIFAKIEEYLSNNTNSIESEEEW